MPTLPSTEQTARLRAELIMRVRCGLMTAAEAARQLGASRKTFYKWEQRGLCALFDSVTDQHPGRPLDPGDKRCQALEKQLIEAKRDIELLNHKMALKDVLMDLKLPATGSDRAKKNERVQQAVAMIEKMKTTFSLSYACLADQMGLRYRTLMRWKRRLASGLPAVGKRGPKKVRPLNLNELKAKARDLDHGPQRSRGTGRLHSAYGEPISRRELNALVIQARSESNRRRKAERSCVSWLRPNLAWAVDDCLGKPALRRGGGRSSVLPF